MFRTLIERRGLVRYFNIDSAGTHDYHTGSPPDARAIAHAAKRGYDLSQLRARPMATEDFVHFEYILAMDKSNLLHLASLSPSNMQRDPELLLMYSTNYRGQEVPDPYYGDPSDFERALGMIEDGCEGLIDFLVRRLNLKT